MTPDAVLGASALAIWLYLLIGRGRFWLARQRDDREPMFRPDGWPSVVAIVPARDEADVIDQSIQSLLRQDYTGALRIVLVDDGSADGTAESAARAAESLGVRDRLDVVMGSAVPAGWTGKLWALQQGVHHVTQTSVQPDYLLLTDADIGHTPDNVRSLVTRAEVEGRVLVSLMAELSCTSLAERFLIPAFVFFFQMLYPFAWVARKERAAAAAAGGCMLVHRAALQRAGGIASIQSEIVDDCALARRLKAQGPIWLGLTRRARSLRPYGGLQEIGRMISRSAYAQLGYSPLLLAGTIAGLAWIYLVPPILTIIAAGPAQWMGLGAWVAMALALQPMLRFYRVSPLWGLAMPAIAMAYGAFTINSALQMWRGRGGMWKGRAQAMTGGT
jgi:hopene-associated glycosyltransferase HpnB